MKVIALIAFLLPPFLSAAQHQIRLAYYGETITHYGIRAGYDYSVKNFVHTKSNDVTIRKDVLMGGSLAAFRHPHQLVGLILSPDFTFRRTGKRGGIIDLNFSPAYFRYFYEGSTYKKSGDGFDKVPLAGRSAFLPTLSIGGGRDLSIKRQLPFIWYYRVNLMKQYPHNASSLTRIALEAGVIRKF